MSDSLNNKELVAAGHKFARLVTSDMPLIDVTNMITRLAERLDCTTAALREMTKQRDALSCLNAEPVAWVVHARGGDQLTADGGYVANAEGMGGVHSTPLYRKTPASNAYLAEVRAQGVERFLSFCGEENSVFIEEKAYHRSLADAVDEFAAKLRQEGAQ